MTEDKADLKSNENSESTEGYKLEFEIYKHITTLCTAVLLIAMSFWEKVFQSPSGKWPLVIVFIFFLVSIYGSLYSMLRVSDHVKKPSYENDRYCRRGAVGIILSTAGFVIGLVFLISFALCNIFSDQIKQDGQVEVQKAEQSLQDLFTAISEFNYQGIRDVSTKDCQLLENGLVWNVDSLVNAMKTLEGKAKVVYNLENINIKVVCSIALISYRNNAVITSTSSGKEERLEWVESAIFEKHDNSWKLSLLHSTRAKP